MISFDFDDFFQASQPSTVKPHLTATSVIRSPRYYRHFFWPPGKNRHKFSCRKKKTLVDTVTPLKRTNFLRPLVTVLTGFHCMNFNISALVYRDEKKNDAPCFRCLRLHKNMAKIAIFTRESNRLLFPERWLLELWLVQLTKVNNHCACGCNSSFTDLIFFHGSVACHSDILMNIKTEERSTFATSLVDNEVIESVMLQDQKKKRERKLAWFCSVFTNLIVTIERLICNNYWMRFVQNRMKTLIVLTFCLLTG